MRTFEVILAFARIPAGSKAIHYTNAI